MKTGYAVVLITAIVLLMAGHAGPAQAALTVSNQVLYEGQTRNLIYDSDLNITWLDYSRPKAAWQNQYDWAATLSLTVSGTTHDDWRLPSLAQMQHLSITELGNTGESLEHTGDFSNLLQQWYWTNDHPFDPYEHWAIGTSMPAIYWTPYTRYGNYFYALAILPGNVSPDVTTPEPATVLLFGLGIVGLAGMRRFRK
jgi:hypothetical protein